MKLLDLLQNLPLPSLLAATVAVALVLCWTILGLVRLSVRPFGFDPAKSVPVFDVITVCSIMFALMLSFAAAGIWNEWAQARNAVQREAMALENVLALADGLAPDRAAKVKAGVISYAKGAAEQEWPAMAREVDMDDPLYAISDHALVSLVAELSHEAVTPGTSSVAATLLPQIFEARSARLARLTLASSGLSGAVWFALMALIVITLIAVALAHIDDPRTQVVAVNLCALAGAAAFFVILAHDRPFAGVISVSPRPLLQLIDKADAGVSRVVGTQPEAKGAK